MQPAQHIRPKYKLLMFFNIIPEKQDQYYRYMLGEFVPNVQKMGVYMHMAWHVAYGDYPIRKIEFVSENADALRRMFNSPEYQEWEDKLKSFTTDYERKLVHYRNGFQL